MAQRKKILPVGIDNFEKIRTDDFYYIDKTGLITDLLDNMCEVTLFTRPRRFGKSLNISMLEAFFSPDSDKSIFDGLRISGEDELCDRYMGRYPVISVSLKNIDASDFDTAYGLLCQMIRREAIKVDMLVAGDDRFHLAERNALKRLLSYDISPADLYASLYTLTGILEKYYGKKVVVLIDEYDVPLANAFDQGYYDRMLVLIRSLFHHVLKTNDSLKLAVLTSCMRIAKESIFTGLNNLRVLGVTDERADEYFGFTDAEVRELLDHYGLSDKYRDVCEWYDGYRFGNVHVYCPWDVISFCDYARFNTDTYPENYWVNSSGNSIVRKLIECSGSATVRGEIESLINGSAVEKTIRQDLTYQDMYASVDNIWSVLFTTGYLTYIERLDSAKFRLVIPNREVREIFAEQILKLFKKDVREDGETHRLICNALKNRDIPEVERCLSAYLRKTISIRDTAVRRTLRENFYQGILLAILSVKADWGVTSNQEAGDGYSDIIVMSEDYEYAMVIEVKYADDGDMEAVCRRALRQINDRDYAGKLCEDGFGQVMKYGIAFHIKKCRVMLDDSQ